MIKGNELLERYRDNPILKPIPENKWESEMVYNAGAIYEQGKVHIIYRARGKGSEISRLGYASSKDGFHIDERLTKPIFEPQNSSECFGIEDPRLTRIDDRIYMCYTAYGKVPGVQDQRSIQIGMTSISVKDFLRHNWNWSNPIYPFLRVDDKNACLFPKKINGKYIMLHRIPPHIWIAHSNNLREWHNLGIIMSPSKSEKSWDYFKIGIAGIPIKTKDGWLLIYHGVDKNIHYRLGAALLDLKNPAIVLKRRQAPILEPKENYEVKGVVPNVVFSCGSIIKDKLFVYYGGADTVLGVATAKLDDFLAAL